MLPEPRFSESLGDHYLLWFESSNSYSWVDHKFYEFLKSYFESNGKKDFIDKLQTNYNFATDICKIQYERIERYLQSFIAKPEIKLKKNTSLLDKLKFSKKYSLGSELLELQFSEKLLLDLVHPLIAHLEVHRKERSDEIIGIHSYKNFLILQKDNEEREFFLKKDYHKLQGRLLFYMLNQLHQTEEKEWMGLFHASAVSKTETGFLFIGSSGSGKSTLVGLLSAHGYDLMADDAVPVKSIDQKMYLNPAAVSIKEKSLPIVDPFWKDKSTYTKTHSPKGKGQLTYIPMHQQTSTKGIPCPYVIKVNYQKNQAAQLTSLNTKAALEILIPESWISPEAENAASFINWIKSVQFFELTYSHLKDALKLLEDLN